MTDVRLEPMTEDQYKPWRAEAEAHYAQSVAASGQSAQDAARNAADTYAQLLPDESATPGHHFWYAYDGDRRVGFLWVKVTHDTAFVYNVAVEPDVRRQGYGRAIRSSGRPTRQRVPRRRAELTRPVVRPQPLTGALVGEGTATPPSIRATCCPYACRAGPAHASGGSQGHGGGANRSLSEASA